MEKLEIDMNLAKTYDLWRSLFIWQEHLYPRKPYGKNKKGKVGGIYVIYDKNDFPVYVGRTNDFYNRIYIDRFKHDSDDLCKYKDYLYSVKLFKVESKLERLVLEYKYINELKPPFNTQDVDFVENIEEYRKEYIEKADPMIDQKTEHEEEGIGMKLNPDEYLLFKKWREYVEVNNESHDYFGGGGDMTVNFLEDWKDKHMSCFINEVSKSYNKNVSQVKEELRNYVRFNKYDNNIFGQYWDAYRI
ncbi:GIY-YIG nuclease family protein [Halobacillus aidingensis]|uniref:GIY-YIG catalytic domain-containing protein n=1 Tax=Halobacillus aidingensis TaxID=240303 RepID=A0A1H0S902_HALAD|nr:GIY-YIG nuclease family protein [Halobacillus aidingensis]SDP38253.1 GIY-YIG catalytic domain-containing protein [Halobacillus aidingensis]